MNKWVTVVIMAVILSACSRYASNGEHLYLGSRNGQPIIVPPPLTSGNISHLYDLPPQNQNATVSIVPPRD